MQRAGPRAILDGVYDGLGYWNSIRRSLDGSIPALRPKQVDRIKHPYSNELKRGENGYEVH